MKQPLHYLLFLYFLWVFPLFSQQLEWEKIIYNNQVSSFRPMDISTDKDGNIYLAGRYETGDEFFTVRNGITAYTDTTLPYGTRAFVMKCKADGEVIKHRFINGIEAQHIALDGYGRLIVCGFTNSYREKNYEGDRTQGIFACRISPTLDTLLWHQIYASPHNSTPSGMALGNAGSFFILGDDELAHGSWAGVEAVRLLKCNLIDGKTLKDSTLQLLSNYFAYDIRLQGDSIYLAATGPKNGSSSYSNHDPYLIVADTNFAIKQLYSTTIEPAKDDRFSKIDGWGYQVLPLKTDFLLAGIAHYNKLGGFVLRADERGNIKWNRFYDSDIFAQPKLQLLPNGNILVGSITDDYYLLLSEYSLEGKALKSYKSTTPMHELGNICPLPNGDILVCCTSKKPRKNVYLAKIRW